MPTYQYACTQCSEELEAVQSFSDPALTECPVCGGRLRKVYGAVGVVFKGSGFYKNDSRSAPAGAKSGDGDGSSGGTKAEGGAKGDAATKSEGGAKADSGGAKSDGGTKSGSGDAGSGAKGRTPATSGAAKTGGTD